MTSALSPGERRAYQANVWKLYIYTLVGYFQLWWPIWVIYLQDERKLSLTQVAALESSFWVGVVLLQVPAGALADRWGRKPCLILGSLVTALSVFLFGIGDTYAILQLSFLTWAVGVALQWGKDAAFLYDSLKALGREHEYPQIYGRLWALTSVAVLVAMPIGAPVAAATNLVFPILLSAVILLAAALVATTFSEPRSADSEQRPAYWPLIRQGVRLAVRLPTVRYMILLFGALSVSSLAPIIFFQPFLIKQGIALEHVGLLQVPARVLAIAGALAAYRLVATWGESRTVYAMLVLAVSCYAGLALWDSVGAIALFPLLATVISMARPVVSTYLNRRIPSHLRATTLSLGEMAYSIVMAAFLPVMAAVSDEVSMRAAFWMAAIVMGVTAGGILMLWTRATRAERLAEEVVPV